MRAFGSASFLSLCLLLALTGCAKFLEKFGRGEKGYTEVSFGNGQGKVHGLATLGGQLMVYAVSADGSGPTRTFHFQSEDAANDPAAAVLIRNGSYRFYFVGFRDSGMQTGVKCGQANSGQPVMLGGGQVNVQAAMSAVNCSALTAFSSSSSATDANGFKAVDLFSCAMGLDLSTLTISSDCTSGDEGDINHLRSAKVELAGYETFSSAPATSEAAKGGIDTGCIRGTGKPDSSSAFTHGSSGAYGLFANENGIFFGMSGSGIYRSTDGGASFSQVANIGTVEKIHGSGTKLIAGHSANGVYLSSNGGSSWSQDATLTSNIGAVFAVSSSVLYAGHTTNYKLYKSTDGGSSWTDMGAPLGGAINSLYYDAPTNSLYVGGENGSSQPRIARSTDGGSSFTTIFSDASGTTVNVVKRLNGYLYWGTTAGLYRSANADGSSPTQYCLSPCTNSYLPGNAVRDVLVSDKGLFVATSGGIGVSVGAVPDTASSWENYTSTELTSNYSDVYALTEIDGKLFFGTYNISATDQARKLTGKGSGTSFPAASYQPHIPAGGTTALPLATRITIYDDPSCQTNMRSYFFPNGIAGGPSESGEARFVSGAATESRLFLRSF